MRKENVNYDEEFIGKLYGGFLKANYKHYGIAAKQMVKGLCSVSMLSQIENGKKQAGWLLKERLLRRAGVTNDAYETFLNCEDYAEWKMQNEILKAIESGDEKWIVVTLESYAAKYYLDVERREKDDVTKRLRQQFYLGMKGMYRKQQKAEAEELVGIFGEAVRLTVPGIDTEPLLGLVLCPEEINLILEYTRCLAPDEAQRRYRELQSYLQGSRMEDETKVQNYPKVIFILCQFLLEQARLDAGEWKEVIQLCDSGIELLQNTKKGYYLTELLEIQEKAVCQIRELDIGKLKEVAMAEQITEIEEYRNCFAELHQRFCMSREQMLDIWLYQQQDIFCIGDIIRIRRKMLGMTMEELCQDICSKDTLQRLEHKKKSTQPAIVWELCRKLRLSPESERTELMTTSPRARELEKKIRYGANEEKFQENLVQLEELKTLIDMTEPINRQWVLRTEGMVKYELKQISHSKYEEMVKEALKCTLPLSILELSDDQECYLTNSEKECFYYLSRPYYPGEAKEAEEKLKLVFRLEREFKETEEERNHIRTYELYMVQLAGILYERGKYECSRQYAANVIQLSLQIGRGNLLDLALYEWVRSNVKLCEKEKVEKETYNWKKDLEYCLLLSQFFKNGVREKFYKGILNMNEKKISTVLGDRE